MKVLLILALAAAVSAEADPQLLYKSLLPTTYVQQPLVYKQPAVVYKQPAVVYKQQPLVYKQAVPVVVPKYQASSPGVSHTVLKREAEADHHYMTYGYPAVQPLVYKQPVVQPLVYKQPIVTPVVYNAPLAVKTYSNDAVKAEDYASKGKYHAENAGAIHIAKREAEADHHYMTYGYPAVQPLVYKQPVVTPVVYKAQPVNYAPGSFANDAVKPFDYAAKGKYVANSAGTVHIAKREADPYTIGYNTYQTGPLSFVKQPIVAQPSSFYPVTYHTLGKREAEAEAEPWTVYGGAYSYPYTTYGGYGYRTPYSYYGNRFFY